MSQDPESPPSPSPAPVDSESSAGRNDQTCTSASNCCDWLHEDILAIVVGGSILTIAMIHGWFTILGTDESHPWKALLGGKRMEWSSNPLEALLSLFSQTAFPFAIGLVGFGIANQLTGKCARRFSIGYLGVAALAVLSFLLSSQSTIKHLNLEYALWALLVGLLISNTIGTPAWLRAGMATELYIKTGLVMYGVEVLWHRLVALGLPGVCISWIVTPIVLITTYWFGQRILRISSASLNMVISADMSVCGVSAAIATAAACRAKKEELSLAIGMSLCFTVVMMVVMPLFIKYVGLDPYVAGAWIGGTIDSTGAVAAAGETLGKAAAETAMTVKMIQNILIGVTALGVAIYWSSYVDTTAPSAKPGLSQLWKRFPKFVLGFVLASIVATLICEFVTGGEKLVDATTGSTKSIREWFFCTAFVCIGLESRFADFAVYLKEGKPLVLYLCGQALNLALTFAMAYLMFGILFPQAMPSP